MDETLAQAYRQTDYRVRLECGGVAVIHIGSPAPPALLTWIGHRPWSVITAFNPMSQPTSRAANRTAQRALLANLCAHPDTAVVRAALGVGTKSWREPSLFIVGPAQNAMDELCRRYRQHACVLGIGLQTARLHWVT
jgi:hypothetical protein